MIIYICMKEMRNYFDEDQICSSLHDRYVEGRQRFRRYRLPVPEGLRCGSGGEDRYG